MSKPNYKAERLLLGRTIKYLRGYRRQYREVSGFNSRVVAEAFKKCGIPYTKERATLIDNAR